MARAGRRKSQERQQSNCNCVSFCFEWMKGGRHFQHDVIERSMLDGRRWRVESAIFGDMRVCGWRSILRHCELIWWWNNERNQWFRWVLVKCNEMPKIRCEHSFWVVLPVLFYHNKFSWKDKNKFKISIQCLVNNVRLGEDRTSPKPVEWGTSSSKGPLKDHNFRFILSDYFT